MATRPSKARSQKRSRAPVPTKVTTSTPLDDDASLNEAVALLGRMGRILTSPAAPTDIVAQLRSFMGVPQRGPRQSPKSLQERIRRELNAVEDKVRNPIDESKTGRQTVRVDIEKQIDALLVSSGVNSKKVRGVLARSFAKLAERAASGQSLDPILSGVERFANTTLPRPLPEKAPKLFKKGENILEFLRDPEGWGPWTIAATGGGALSRPQLRKYDELAYAALHNWLKHNKLPDDMSIPTRREATDNLLILAAADPETILDRVGWAISGRIQRRGKKPAL